MRSEPESVHRHLADPPSTDAASLCRLGWSHHAAGRWSGAELAFRAALARDPACDAAKSGLALACLRNHRWCEGHELVRACIEADPANPDHWSLLAKFDRAVGEIDQSVAHLRTAIALAPDDPWVAQRLLVQLSLLPGASPEAVGREHAAWAARFAAPFYPAHPPVIPPLATGGRLRIGYVSPDWREHPVGYFSEGLLRHHDRRHFEVFCYSRHGVVDDRARVLSRLPEHWVETTNWDDTTLARRIQQDGIHLLIDLAGHTRGGCPLVMARQPAPVQVTFLGYPATTGIATIGHRLTDALADPPGLTDGHGTERLVRLPETAWCFVPSADTPPVNPLPTAAVRAGVTFGNFANRFKHSTATLDLWTRVLHAVKGSRLVLKCPGFADPGIRARTLARFTESGIGADRVRLREPLADRASHLAAYHDVDIAVDTYPYHGTATTCDALHMGVPVVSLAGPGHVSRVGASLLRHAGLADSCLAYSMDEFVARAVALAGDRPALARLRQELRPRLERSPLMDAVGYARRVEAALRGIWEEFASQRPPAHGNLRP